MDSYTGQVQSIHPFNFKWEHLCASFGLHVREYKSECRWKWVCVLCGWVGVRERERERGGGGGVCGHEFVCMWSWKRDIWFMILYTLWNLRKILHDPDKHYYVHIYTSFNFFLSLFIYFICVHGLSHVNCILSKIYCPFMWTRLIFIFV